MSAFISGSSFSMHGLVTNKNDDTIQPPDYRQSAPQMAAWANMLRDTDILWPRSSFPSQLNANGNGFTGLEGCHQYWEWNWPPSGVHVHKMISGVTLDKNGNVVVSATVKLFNASTDLLVDTKTSNANDGSFTLGDPNNTTNYVVAFKAGSPDITGATDNNLSGS